MFGALDWSVLWRPPFGEQIIGALWLTVEIAFVSWILAMILGIFVGFAREAPIAAVRLFASGYVEIFRNIPVLVQLFFIYFVVPRVLPPGARHILFDLGWEVLAAILALSFYSSAKIAEHVRAGMNTVGNPLRQAALATGLTWWQASSWPRSWCRREWPTRSSPGCPPSPGSTRRSRAWWATHCSDPRVSSSSAPTHPSRP